MGSGYRTFTAGEVLTASNVQNFLQDQAVMVFADSTARETAIGTANFEEGMVSYLEDSDTVEVYNGTTWGNIAPTSTQGLTLINTTSFSGVTSVSLPADTFTSTFDNYCLIGDYTTNQSVQTALTARMRAAGSDDTTSNYYVTNVNQNTSNTQSFQSTTGQTSWTNIQRLALIPHRFEMVLYAPKLVKNTAFNFRGMGIDSTNALNGMTTAGGEFSATTSFDSISFIAGAGNITGTISCYAFNI
jgi:hypothetical protein